MNRKERFQKGNNEVRSISLTNDIGCFDECTTLEPDCQRLERSSNRLHLKWSLNSIVLGEPIEQFSESSKRYFHNR